MKVQAAHRGDFITREDFFRIKINTTRCGFTSALWGLDEPRKLIDRTKHRTNELV